MAVDLTVERELFGALGALATETHGPLSPWAAGGHLTEDQRRQLRTQGAVDAHGHPSRGLVAAVDAIASAKAISKIRLYGGGVEVGYANFCGTDGSSVSVPDRGETLRLESPAPFDRQIAAMGDLVGLSSVRPMHFSVEVSPFDALVLATLIDAERRQSLTDLANDASSSPRPLTMNAIVTALKRPPAGAFWLVNAVARAIDTPPSAAASGASDATRRLAGRGLAEISRGRAKAAGEAKELATRFLVVQTLIELENDRAEGGGAVRSGLTCVRGGAQDFLSIERSAQGARLATLSAAAVLTCVDVFGRRPDWAPAFGATHVVLPGAPAATWSSPDTNSTSLAAVPAGTPVRILHELDGWAEVESGAGRLGWLDRRCIGELGSQPAGR